MGNNANLKSVSLCHKKHLNTENRMKTPFRIVCLFIACAFIVHGISRGEALVVLNKAVNICLECIGLG